MILIVITLGWKIVFFLTIVSFFVVLYVFIKGCMNAGDPPNETVLPYIHDEHDSATYGDIMKITINELIPEGPIVDESDPGYKKQEEDEFSLDSIISDETLQQVRLRQKLIEIEKIRQDDV